MFTIRNEQFSALRSAAREELARRIDQHIAEQLPHKAAPLDAPQRLARVERAMARAYTYGLDTERDLATFVSLDFTVREGFDTHPRIQGILTDAFLPASLRMEALLTEVTLAEWAELAGPVD
ncbi:MAG: hypothetical protein JNK87_37825 [Bryobacterales bacterium]|nr:hypothetical protein [Bryobacterales bacterium]